MPTVKGEMRLVILRRPRKFPGLRPCSRCNHQFEWEDVVKDPTKRSNTRNLFCFDCVRTWGVITHTQLAWQGVFGTEPAQA